MESHNCLIVISQNVKFSQCLVTNCSCRMPLLPFIPPRLLYFINPEELRHHVGRTEEGNQNLTLSLNPKDGPKEPSMKQARTGSLSLASHLSSASVRLSCWCRLGCACLTDIQTSPGGFTVCPWLQTG